MGSVLQRAKFWLHSTQALEQADPAFLMLLTTVSYSLGVRLA
jgi:hypothetical protein